MTKAERLASRMLELCDAHHRFHKFRREEKPTTEDWKEALQIWSHTMWKKYDMCGGPSSPSGTCARHFATCHRVDDFWKLAGELKFLEDQAGDTGKTRS